MQKDNTFEEDSEFDCMLMKEKRSMALLERLFMLRPLLRQAAIQFSMAVLALLSKSFVPARLPTALQSHIRSSALDRKIDTVETAGTLCWTS